MRVFVTGATGFIGSAVVQELISEGHEVLGLARSDAAAKSLSAAGAKVHRGDLQDLDSLRAGAGAAAGVIHTGFNHDFSKFGENCENERKAVEALGSALAGSDCPLIITSGIGLLPPGHLATEQTMPASPNPNPRVASEEAGRAVADRRCPHVADLEPGRQGLTSFMPLSSNCPANTKTRKLYAKYRNRKTETG